MFVRRAVAGTEVARIVGVDAVGDGRHSALLRERVHLIEEFVLAVVAAVRIVRHVEGIFEFRGVDEFMVDAGGRDELIGFSAIRAARSSRKLR